MGRPSILLVTLDTTRADRIGAYGHAAAHTPTLDRLAREGVLFERAMAPTPTTLPSHTSILTGVPPNEHGVRDNSVFSLGPEARLVSEVFQAEGWRTAAFVGAFVLDPRFGLDQGFEAYGASRLSQASSAIPERPANRVVKEALGWLSTLEPGVPFFVWVHFFDPHRPLEAPPRWRARVPDPYQAEIAFCDQQLGRLLAGLDEMGLDGNLLTVVTADHGEGLGEHREATHGLFLYQSTLHVPLVVHGPPVRKAAGTRVAHVVSVLDIAPTLLGLAGLSGNGLPAARSVALFDGEGRPAAGRPGRSLYLETLTPFHSFGWRASRGLVRDGRKLIAGAPDELYALDDDPGETKDIAQREPEQVAGLAAALAARADRPPLGWGRSRGVSSEEAARLAALGYVAGRTGGDPFDPSLADPSQHAEAAAAYARLDDQVRRARELLGDHGVGAVPADAKARQGLAMLREARDGYAELRAVDPANPYLTLNLGMVESMLGNHAAALPLLERARDHDAGRGRVHYHLALAYEAAARHPEARRALAVARSLEPDEPFYAEQLEALEAREAARAGTGSARIRP